MSKKPTDRDYERAAKTVRDMLDAREKPARAPRPQRSPKPPPGAQSFLDDRPEPAKGAYDE